MTWDKSVDFKIGVSSRGESPLSDVCGQFGRSYWLLIYSSADCSWQAINNSLNRTRPCGAGVATAETMVAAGVNLVLTGETGPKAFRILRDAGISMVHDVGGTVEEALADWLGGRLLLAHVANDPGSPNCLLGSLYGSRENQSPL